MTGPSFVSALTAGLALASTAAALPAGAQQERGFAVEQIRNPRYVRSGPLALAKAYRKYKAPLPEDLAAVVANISAAGLVQRATGSVAANPQEYDIEYLSPVQIGTPAQTLNLDFDTGSSDLWVFSTSTPASQRNGQTVYDPSKSSTASRLSGATWSISYGDGSSSGGIVYKDTVSVGGLSVTGQAVEAASTVSDSFTSESDLDGLLGLGFSNINTVEPTQQTTFFDTAKSKLTAPLFTADLKHNKAGKYNFGYIDTAAYTGSIAYTSVNSANGWWQFTSSGYQVGSNSFVTSSITGIADTGTTLLLLPNAVVTAYYSKITGAKYDSSQGGYTFPCSATVPSFTFGVGTARVTIPGSYLNYAPISTSTCFGGLQSNTGIGISIYGDIALKAAFVVFNGGTKQLGWAAKTLS
ncbi:secreted aspartic proteinase precursor [Colletotrichum tofieldiae]|uniref:Secreted aspartic proteinase (Endothiapepsin) n=1 Tax=Colletotrichum tofieldiae TaxID=708197 RepID=A0A166UPP0_9PEZI|nr:secreted aspartic proteinase precursor (endothiapepsin) [Colletotrichum tofieldiae]GKT64158.1 secreted aspartic proteinase precursor [Colletotrichum tofieldiae]GKT74111.1 secreted aspartic proteinase precursor [Colletotrichum tofieldiae]GKT97168.1 secreted aspartic proteinase precursor [Colletotrichum tofieldiae]